MPYTINRTDFKIGNKYSGKVRDVYDLNDTLLIVTTDRISAFDRILCEIPFKGEILNNLSLFWFENTKDIIPNHIIRKVSENAVLVKKCSILPIEIIIRGYLTGGGWREYSKTGEISGLKLPKGLKKDSKFDKPILTPTTKAQEGHDLPISVDEIIKQGIIQPDLMKKIEETAIKLFERGQEIVKKNNLILVDTKYEFGLLDDGTLIVADEMHTSDSSRFWFLDSYQSLFDQAKEQKMLDKEYLRQYLLSVGYQGDGEKPEIPFDIKVGVLERYVLAYELITGNRYILKNYDAIDALSSSVNELMRTH
ncbi:MAG: phosphoribosylaminoimidazolesuccinocarboxamide synthase [Spirochaetes bacterium GWF1_31_7]|nr:MAG: phosphoribosylaminoimidazolesuccinocarboxamide synthase [Spirochaetes bacterium GWE1_32_154]OHD52904.1 MAG: phosphoribosylaminoimidazolesuccinocarboxamide synthase [Spirochaetes bacterium GWE2_31_10]OHD53155.1 MAG: phosphoribosylaminoimidazolesuccinocarboxamide synthase [Spirochaetes bacterium GWF1_31_7]